MDGQAKNKEAVEIFLHRLFYYYPFSASRSSTSLLNSFLKSS